VAQFIDLTATAAVGRKAEREVYALAGAEIARAALRQWSPCRQRDRRATDPSPERLGRARHWGGGFRPIL